MPNHAPIQAGRHFQGIDFYSKLWQNLADMSQWNISASALFILSCVVFLMLLIVVLPDVDLPDTAFHRGTAPEVLHAKATDAPVAVIVATIFQFSDSGLIPRLSGDSGTLAEASDPNFRPILLRSIRC